MSKIKIFISTKIWNFCEFWKIPLGDLGPVIFNGMMGAYKNKRIK